MTPASSENNALTGALKRRRMCSVGPKSLICELENLKMSPSSESKRLCLVVGDCLRPYAELDGASLTKENENNLLVSLSQVFRELKHWTRKLSSDSDSDTDNELVSTGNSECSAELHANSEDHHCFSNIIADLIYLLTVESQYVRHLVSNILVGISEFVAASGCNWDAIIRLLCTSLELAFRNTLLCLLPSSATEAGCVKCVSSSFAVALKPKLRSAGWSTVACIIGVLRNILKFLKQEDDDQLVDVYLNAVNSCLSSFPWNLLDKIFVGQNCGILESSVVDTSLPRNAGREEPRIMFLGNFFQLLCSLVEQIRIVEASDDSIEKDLVPFIINCLVPKLLNWCLGKHGGCVDVCILQYFRHKLLVLMIRLSFLTHLKCSVLVLWLQFLQNYFEELLSQPITPLGSSQDDCLEGSPFLFSASDGELHTVNLRHLQRLSVFLFVRCSFYLTSRRGNADKHCTCLTPNSNLTFDSDMKLDCQSEKMGFTELSKWLKGQLPSVLYSDHETYWENCIAFSSSFLKLYIHEDDLLFKVLLQLLSVPFSPGQGFHQERKTFNIMDEDILFHVSNLFNPVHLFHQFLAELEYDHQVILDYLISKDTGTSCAEYLLRCLRTVCDTWNLFVDFLVGGKGTNQSMSKKRKVSIDGLVFQVDLSSTPVQNDGTLLLVENECKSSHQDVGNQYRNERQPFEKAKKCLFSLKNSLESLHQKTLFPYDPIVLLKRLTRFQELCAKQD